MRMSKDAELCDVDCYFRRETEKGVAVADGTKFVDPKTKEHKEKWFWLPRSLIEIEQKKGDHVVITMPRWLAEEKGLV